MTHHEMKYVVAFLKELSNRFGNDGCNDMFLADTPENRQLVLAAEQYADIASNEIRLFEVRKGESKKIGTMNDVVLDYLMIELAKENGIDMESIPDVE